MIRRAYISGDGIYRYWLTREWFASTEEARWICFVGLNPSTADDKIDDPTIRREIGFAKSIGATALIKVNLYAYRATKPADLERFIAMHGTEEAMGEENQHHLQGAADAARHSCGYGVVAAWGALSKRLEAGADAAIEVIGAPLMCLGVTKNQSPRHPLYLPKTACPFEWKP